MQQKLHRSVTDRQIAGVCGGLAETFGWDATLIRVLALLLALTTGSGFLAYLVMWIVVPEGPAH